MALGKVDRARESTTRHSRRRLLRPTSRYDACHTIEESGIVRLAFKRYAQFDATEEPTTRRGAVMPGSENRVDCMSMDAYSDKALLWALVMFNRESLTDLNPLRFEVGSVLGVPSVSYIAKRLREDVIVDV